jgi:hypothetical protein
LTIKHWRLPVLLPEDLTKLELPLDLREETRQQLRLMPIDSKGRSVNHYLQKVLGCTLLPWQLQEEESV